ncbi:MAG: alpha/beta hydrolase [Acidobacteria bacterium]|nr:MAG: alpha/beta hydrolase [Acidobacteriota bacterium]
MMSKPSTYTPRFTGGHKQTLFAWARPRRFPHLPAATERIFDVAADARVLAHCHAHPDGPRRTLILLHGLEGSSMAHYMRGVADKAWAAGWNVVRLNQRNCGGTERLSRGLYHSGLTHDVQFVMRELIERDRVPAVAVAGYSLGGNLALKLAGELGDAAPPELVGVCAVSPTMDLAACVAALERKSNVAYEWNFVRNLKGRLRRKAAAVPGLFPLEPLKRIWTVRQFDEAYTAPHHGFRDAYDYYHRASAMRVIERIHVPALIITAEDDPFVPVSTFRDAAVTSNPHITVVITRHGGHCAYVEQSQHGYDGYWAEREIVRFIEHQVRPGRDAASGSSRTQDLSPTLRA